MKTTKEFYGIHDGERRYCLMERGLFGSYFIEETEDGTVISEGFLSYQPDSNIFDVAEAWIYD